MFSRLRRFTLVLTMAMIAVLAVTVGTALAQDGGAFPTDALTKDALKSIAGQAVAIFIVVEGLKRMFPSAIAGRGTQLIALLVGIGLQLLYVARGTGWDAYPLAVINGFISAYLAMKGADQVKPKDAEPANPPDQRKE